MKVNECPICGKYECSFERSIGNFFTVQCNTFKYMELVIDKRVFIGDDIKENSMLINLSVLDQLKHRGDTHFYYYDPNRSYEDKHGKKEKYINIMDLIFKYPKSFLERVEKSLYNLFSRYELFDFEIVKDNVLPAEVYCEIIDEGEKNRFFEMLVVMGYLIEIRLINGSINYRFTPKAWSKLDLIRKKSLNKGFIAMSFDKKNDDLKSLLISTIKHAGYGPVIMSDYQHNNYIVPEIFFHIEQSKFMIVDVSDKNFGAYYEAGYGQALGKEVIVICNEEIFNDNESKPHFDIAQKNTIIFSKKNFDNLERDLTNRIEATVGLR